MKVLAFYANGTEDSELIITIDLLRRAGIEVKLVSIENEVNRLSHNLYLKSEALLNEMSDSVIDSYDGLFLPGGKEGTMKFKEHYRLHEIIKRFHDSGKLISAICAAPSVFGQLGLLENRNFTCYDGWNETFKGGNYKNEGFIRDGNIITGRSLNYSIEFSLEIIDYLLGENEKIKVAKGILRC